MKKGFIKTLEAVIAVILIVGFLYFVMPKQFRGESEAPENVRGAQEFILNGVSGNKEFRECVLNSLGSCKKGSGCVSDINNFTKGNIPVGYDYECEMCASAESCIVLPRETLEKSIYVDTFFISAQQSRVFRLYIWRKG